MKKNDDTTMRFGEGNNVSSTGQDCRGANNRVIVTHLIEPFRNDGSLVLLGVLFFVFGSVCFPLMSTAQQFSSLGLISNAELPSPSLFTTTLFLDGDSIPDLVYYNPEDKRLIAVYGKGDGSFVDQVTVYETDLPTSIVAGRLNSDYRMDIVVVHREKSEIDVVLCSPRDSLPEIRQYPVNFYPEKAVIADIDGDGINDILVYGKLSSGVSVLLGTGNGGFQKPRLILDDIPVIDLAVTKLNDDLFPDIVAKNWLQNELLFLSGKGDLQFSIQQAIAFGSDTAAYFLGDFNGDGLLDYGTISKQKFQLFLGEGLETFTLYQTGEYVRSVSRAIVAPVTGQRYPDILLFDELGGTIDIFTNRGDGTFNDGIVFGLPPKTGICTIVDINNDGWNDVVLFENQGTTVTTFWNGRQTYLAQLNRYGGKREIKMPSGKRPIGLAVADLNSDGYDDIIAANNASSSVSVFLNSPAGFTGQIGFRTIDNPYTVRLYSKTDTSQTFLLSHESKGRVSILQAWRDTVTSSGYSTFTYSIRTADNPKIILPYSTLQDKGIEFYTYSGDRQNILSYYRQVEGTRFIERSLKPIIPSKILSASVNDFNDDGRPDIAYLYYDTDSSNYNLAITFSDSNGMYRGKTRSYIFTDSVIRRSSLYFEDMNGDNINDCILFSMPDNSVKISLGKGDGIFGPFSVVVQGISLVEPEHLQVFDFNRDGINDIVLLNEQTSELIFLKGKGNGKYYPPIFLLDLPKNSTFRFGDFNVDGTLDIAYSNPSQNQISVYYSIRK
jgi:hypothetical protein